MRAAWLVLLATSACTRGDYLCTADTDCDVGTAGRCEADHRCTVLVSSIECPTGRKYSDLQGEVSNQCFSDAVAPLNGCAAGQAPAVREAGGCFATVCDAMPSCCATGWSEQCVQLAQQACDARCDTRIAVTALTPQGGGLPDLRELFDLRWTGTTWTYGAVTGSRFVTWLAPAPGTTEPRLASVTADNTALVIAGGGSVLLDPTASYEDAASVDFERAGLDTVALSRTLADTTTRQLVIAHPGDALAAQAPITVNTQLAAVWDSVNGDGFPDAIAFATAQYWQLANVDGTGLANTLIGTQVNGGAPALRTAVFADVDGDHVADAVIAGRALDYAHDTGTGLVKQLSADCTPPVPQSDTTAPCLAATEFAVAALPSLDGASDVIAGIAGSELKSSAYQVAIDTAFHPVLLPGFSVPGSRGIIALAARDLDGDRQLDTIAIDADLNILYSLTTKPGLVSTVQGPRQTPTPAVREARISVSGRSLP